jgi:crotonobetainyl-CoA:carnitine CoA-transferase CaiB-like acyl-CoA transferase
VDRTLGVGELRFAACGSSHSSLGALRWLSRLGAAVVGVSTPAAASTLDPSPLAVLVAGDAVEETDIEPQSALSSRATGPTQVWLWDFERNQIGVGAFASAVSGVSAVIGEPDGPPGLLPAHLAEKWCGIVGASLALSLAVSEGDKPRRIDVSAADVLRSFAEQNSGNHAGVPYGWRRNGRVAVEHGGVFPQGFFACRDGYVAIQARSRRDWFAILEALGDPAWSHTGEMRNPFTLSEDDSTVSALLEAELAERDRAELLEASLATGATMAPVLGPDEVADWDVFRPGFHDADGHPREPFVVRRAPRADPTEPR